ncbi:MAG TPA: DUF4390 domain-containing protein [Steroidobacteraceae bacterium]|nr:DUF4390 domain-containing protein [Steroidobacteraceae bacterium]
MTRAFAFSIAAMLSLAGTCARADALDGVLRVVSAYVDIEHSVYTLHARIEYPMTPAIEEALRDGVTLTFELEARVMHDRHLWFDAVVVDLMMRRELAYHSISDRYVVRDMPSGEQQSFATLDDALMYLSAVDDWPILVGSQLAEGQHYYISVRAGIRRGRLPASLRALLFWTDDWHRMSEWFTWALPS